MSARLTNVGQVAGEEVVQLYVRDIEASTTRPVIELKSFMRVGLEAGASRLISFEVPVGQLGFYDREFNYVVEDGEIEFLVGTSSAALLPAGSVSIKSVGTIEKPSTVTLDQLTCSKKSRRLSELTPVSSKSPLTTWNHPPRTASPNVATERVCSTENGRRSGALLSSPR